MGIYYTTVFYPNYNDKQKKITIADIDRVIEQKDIDRGYIDMTDLLDTIDYRQFTEYSMIVECCYTTYDDVDAPPTITHILPVK